MVRLSISKHHAEGKPERGSVEPRNLDLLHIVSFYLAVLRNQGSKASSASFALSRSHCHKSGTSSSSSRTMIFEVQKHAAKPVAQIYIVIRPIEGSAGRSLGPAASCDYESESGSYWRIARVLLDRTLVEHTRIAASRFCPLLHLPFSMYPYGVNFVDHSTAICLPPGIKQDIGNACASRRKKVDLLPSWYWVYYSFYRFASAIKLDNG